MKLVIDIPDEYYKSDFLRNDNKFNEFFSRIAADIDYTGCCGKYEEELTEMLKNAFDKATLLDKNTEYAKDCMNLDKTIAKFIVPRLKYFRENTDLYPENDEIKSYDQWLSMLDDMIHAFELLGDEDYTGKTFKDNIEDISRGLVSFCKYYTYLWI